MWKCIKCKHAEDAIPNSWKCPVCHFEPEKQFGSIPLLAKGYVPEVGGFDPSAFENLCQMEATNFWFTSRNHLILWVLSKVYPPSPDSSFLEVGCGTGFVLSAIVGGGNFSKVYGTDLFHDGLVYAKNRVPGAVLFQSDVSTIPFCSAFNVVGAFDVLEHIDDDTMALRQINGVLTDDGWLVLTVPQHSWLWSVTDIIAKHVRRYDIGEIECKLQATGFTVCYSTSFVSLLLPLMVLSRRTTSSASQTTKSDVGLNLPIALNMLLRAIMSFELWLISHGVRFTYGGSRVVLARKVTNVD